MINLIEYTCYIRDDIGQRKKRCNTFEIAKNVDSN